MTWKNYTWGISENFAFWYVSFHSDDILLTWPYIFTSFNKLLFKVFSTSDFFQKICTLFHVSSSISRQIIHVFELNFDGKKRNIQIHLLLISNWFINGKAVNRSEGIAGIKLFTSAPIRVFISFGQSDDHCLIVSCP